MYLCTARQPQTMKKIVLCFCVLLSALSLHAQHAPQVKPVYMFGFATSFTDSLAYITDIQRVDSAYLYKNGFLADRTHYSRQLADMLEKTGQTNMTCAVFFSPKKATVEKKYLRVKRRFARDHGVAVTPLGSNVFQFKAVPYEEVVVKEVEQ